MISKRIVFLGLFTLVLSIVQLNGQSFTISGFLTDKSSGEVLVGAYVYCPQTGAGGITNNAGFYALSLPYGTKNIMYMAEGYAAKIDTTAVNRNKHVDVVLRELEKGEGQMNPFENTTGTPEPEIDEENDAEKDEEEVKVKKPVTKNTAKVDTLIKLALARNIKIIDRVENGFIEVPGLQISNLPSLVGEIDVIRGLKFLPGAMPGTELTNGLYVRGGNQDQNLVLMDGSPVYNMNHFYGFYSVFNVDGINSINLTKSGFSAKHGGRLSSITDITMKEGNSQRVRGLFSYSPVAVRLEMNGPLSKDGRTTFAFSARRSWIDLIMRLGNDDTNKMLYVLYDFNIKVCHRFNDKSKLIFSFFNCRDRQYQSFTEFDTTVLMNKSIKTEYDLRWGNVIGSVRWNRVFNDKLFSSFSGSYSQYKNQFPYNVYSTIDTGNGGGLDLTEYRYKYFNIIRDFTAKADFDYNANRSNTLHFGAAFTIRGFIPGTINRKYISNGVTVSDTNVGNTKALVGNEYAVYLEDEFRITNNFKVAAGARLVYYKYQSQDFLFLEPRVSFNLRMHNEYAIKGSYTVMNQNLYSLENNTNSYFTDRWMPATSKTPPQRAQQISLGVTKPLNRHLELSVDGYYKILSKVLEVKEGATFGPIDKNIEDKLVVGKGWCYGVETFLHKKKGNTSGWMSYTLSWAKRNAPGVNRGEDYYFQFDRRHYINIVLQQKLGDRRFLSVNMVFSTGNVQSVPIGKYRDINGNIIYDYTSKNNYRLPNTFRVDVGFKKIRKKRRGDDDGSERGFNVSVYNIFGRNNPAYIYIVDSPKGTASNPNPPPTAYQRSFLGFIPGISFYNKF